MICVTYVRPAEICGRSFPDFPVQWRRRGILRIFRIYPNYGSDSPGSGCYFVTAVGKASRRRFLQSWPWIAKWCGTNNIRSTISSSEQSVKEILSTSGVFTGISGTGFPIEFKKVWKNIKNYGDDSRERMVRQCTVRFLFTRTVSRSRMWSIRVRRASR